MMEMDTEFYQSINFDITFEQAINDTESFLNLLSSGTLTEEDIESVISLLVMSENGARGFFVTYLTSSRDLADHPSVGVINALKSSIEIVGELLVKNLAMSTATAISHLRNGDEEMAKGSEIVQHRTLNLIKEMNSAEITKKLSILAENIKTDQGEYQSFLKRWGYDTEQKKAITKILPI